MSYFQQLKNLLAPLGVYQWEGTFQKAELVSEGAVLDACAEQLNQIQKEMNLMTAEEAGLDAVCALLSRSPTAETPAQMQQALAALLRINDHSFTLAAVNDNIIGCGIPAVVTETETPGTVQVKFPGVAGIPAAFEESKKIMEDILPCHLDIQYKFWYMSWMELQKQFFSWKELESSCRTWIELEKHVMPVG